jgi:hypothetical protein
MASSILSDNGVTSGVAGLKTSADSDGTLALQTTTAGGTATTAVTINTSQNVGIGTSTFTSGSKLAVQTTAGKWEVISDGSVSVKLKNGGGLTIDSAIGHYFNQGATEFARIDSSGNLLVGTTSALTAGTKLTVSGSNADWMAGVTNTNASPRGLFLSHSTDSNGTANWFLYCEAGGSTQRMSVRSNGGIANYSANNVNLSDRREKNNFAPAKAYLDIVCNIPVQTFNYIDQNLEEDDGLTLGVVAQDVQAVAPELVMESNWGTEEAPKMRLSIYQTDLQYALMKSIQELKAMNDTQAETINALTARIVALEAK